MLKKREHWSEFGDGCAVPSVLRGEHKFAAGGEDKFAAGGVQMNAVDAHVDELTGVVPFPYKDIVY